MADEKHSILETVVPTSSQKPKSFYSITGRTELIYSSRGENVSDKERR
jgi:hypothetical protein